MLRNGSLLLNMRSRELRRLQAYSHDGGETWSPPRPAQPPVPDGNCQGSQISLGDGSLLVATSAGPGRIGLHAHLSTDGGGSWRRSLSQTRARGLRPAAVAPEAPPTRQVTPQAAPSPWPAPARLDPPRPSSLRWHRGHAHLAFTAQAALRLPRLARRRLLGPRRAPRAAPPPRRDDGA